MTSRSLFRDFKLPNARKMGRLPVFLDFTTGCQPHDEALTQQVSAWLADCNELCDGIIVPPGILPNLPPLSQKEIWVRLDCYTFSQPPRASNDNYLAGYPCDLVPMGVTGVLGTLVLGIPATTEADNVQHLALLSSRSKDVGLPFIVELQRWRGCLTSTTCQEMIELGINLVVELGGDAIILPAREVILPSVNFVKVAVIPVLLSFSISGSASQPQLGDESLPEYASGIVYTELQEPSSLMQRPQVLLMRSRSSKFQAQGGK